MHIQKLINTERGWFRESYLYGMFYLHPITEIQALVLRGVGENVFNFTLREAWDHEKYLAKSQEN